MIDPVTLGVSIVIGIGKWIKDIGAHDANVAELKSKKKDAQKLYNENVRTLKEDYKIAQGEAKKNADRADLNLTKTEGYLTSDYNNALAELGLSQQQNSLAVNDSLVSVGSQLGDALSNQALAGTRGSSVMGAIGRQEAYAESRMESSRNMNDRLTDIQLSRAAMGLAQSADNITEGRYQANELRRSYEKGGTNYNRLQNNLTNLKNKNAIEQSAYDRNIKLYDKYNRPDFLNLATDIFSVGTMLTGFQTNLASFNNDFGWDKLFKNGNSLTSYTGSKLNTAQNYKPFFGY